MADIDQHTPRPWHAEEPDEQGHVVVADEQDVSICRCYQQPHDTWTAAANAALIVRAVSNYHTVLDYLDHRATLGDQDAIQLLKAMR